MVGREGALDFTSVNKCTLTYLSLLVGNTVYLNAKSFLECRHLAKVDCYVTYVAMLGG